MSKPTIKKYTLLILILLAVIVFYFCDIPELVSFSHLQHHYFQLRSFTNAHYAFSVFIYTIIFSLLIACTIPCATFLTILGGLLFNVSAILYAELSTVLGGFILYHAVRTAIGSDLAKSRAKGWLHVVRKGLAQDAYHYLLMLRLLPVMPCWVSNIGAGMLNVPQRTFLIATALGILPATIIYVLIGRGLNEVLDAHQIPAIDMLMTPAIILPLTALAIFSLTPILYKRIKQRRKKG